MTAATMQVVPAQLALPGTCPNLLRRSEMSERTCSVDGCERAVLARGWCTPHYNRWRKFRDPLGGGPLRPRDRFCTLDNCDRPHVAKGYCDLHYRRLRENGDPRPDDPPMEQGADREFRTCRRCGETKPQDDFSMRSNGRWRRAHCRACNSEAFGEYRENNRERADRTYWRSMLKRRYGITHEDYDRMFAEQGGRCAICEATECGGGRENFCVDHDHDTGQVRGLLCIRCNHGLGQFGDKIDGVRRALAYMEAAEARA